MLDDVREICHYCRIRPCTPSRVRSGYHTCARCYDKTDAACRARYRYRTSGKVEIVHRRYNHSAKGQARYARYDVRDDVKEHKRWKTLSYNRSKRIKESRV